MASSLQVYQEEFGTVRGHFGPVNAVAFHPDGRRYEASMPGIPVSSAAAHELSCITGPKSVNVLYGLTCWAHQTTLACSPRHVA